MLFTNSIALVANQRTSAFNRQNSFRPNTEHAISDKEALFTNTCERLII